MRAYAVPQLLVKRDKCILVEEGVDAGKQTTRVGTIEITTPQRDEHISGEI